MLFPDFFVAIVPAKLPNPEWLNVISGLLEIVIGVYLLEPRTRVLAAWGAIALAIAVFPANVNMLIENIGPATPNVDRVLKTWWHLLRMWNRPRPAPEYWFSWKDRARVRAALERVLAWDFQRIVIAHGDLIEVDARSAAQQAWKGILGPTAAQSS